MSTELLIEAGEYETRVALLQDGKLVEVHHERHLDRGGVGDIFKGRVSRVVPGIQAAFVDIGMSRDAFLFAGDIHRDNPPIGDEVKQGQELLVQVVKEPLPGKGARISSQISFPGRDGVVRPRATGVGVARRIEDLEERERLESEIRQILPEDCGVIVRTAGEGHSLEQLRQEIMQLEEVWNEVKSRAGGLKAPSLVHQETNLAMRTIRDLLSSEITAVYVEGADIYTEIRRYLEQSEVELVERLRQHAAEEPLFDRFGVDAALSRAMRSRVWLRSGGCIVINPTEALVAIDVNSGRNTEGIELEETARTTNLEAAEEVARQIRLRDLSGIIVVDFIDMLDADNREQLLETFDRALGRDRTRTQISQMSDFGLIAVTRKRMRGGLVQHLTETCPCCQGDGRIKDSVTVGLEIGRELRRRHLETAAEKVVVELHPRHGEALKREGLLRVLRAQVGGELELAENPELQLEEFVIRTGQ